MIARHLPNLAVSRGIQEIMPRPRQPLNGSTDDLIPTASVKSGYNKSGIIHQLKVVKLLLDRIRLKLRRCADFLLNQQQSNQLHVAFHSDVVMRANVES
jgi:hypothetical protein